MKETKIIVTAIGVLSDQSEQGLSDFNPRKALPNRKHLKMMTRDVRLGVAAICQAVEFRGGLEGVDPDRRGLFVGGAPIASDPADLKMALDAATTEGELNLAHFGEVGVPRVPPLWLVKGLSNNIVGFATAYFDIRGANINRCDGRTGGLNAVVDAMHALREGRVDLAIAGGADSLTDSQDWIGRPCGEGAAFFVLERATSQSIPNDEVLLELTDGEICGVEDAEPNRGVDQRVEYGAATGALLLSEAVKSTEARGAVMVSGMNGQSVRVGWSRRHG